MNNIIAELVSTCIVEQLFGLYVNVCSLYVLKPARLYIVKL